MSFGFSIGDFLAVIQLANKIRKDFVGAPSQLKNISDEYVDRAYGYYLLTDPQTQKPSDRCSRCRSRCVRMRAQ